MERRHGMPGNHRHDAIGRLAAGESFKQVAHHFNVRYTTIACLVNRVQHTGTVRDRPWSGRPRATTPKGGSLYNDVITTHQFQGWYTFSKGLATSYMDNNTSTNYVPVCMQLDYVSAVTLNQHHLAARLRWARIHQQWRLRRWNEILFTDESRFSVQFADGRMRVWRRRVNDMTSLTSWSKTKMAVVVLWFGKEIYGNGENWSCNR